MHHLGALRNFLDHHFPRTTNEELLCTCGDGNHARIRYFRVNGQPVTAVIPEGAAFSAGHLREALHGSQVDCLLEKDFDEIFEDTELGHMDWFENPFGAGVFFDDLLAPFRQIVFCPQMFAGLQGECFRVPTEQFLKVTNAMVLPLTAAACSVDDWAV